MERRYQIPAIFVGMKDTEAAWLAGIFDGEGCVWSRWPKRKNVIVEVKMADYRTVSRINDLFPGRFVQGHISGMSKLPQWRWSLDTNGSKRFLELVMPYLVTKREQAEVAILLCDRSMPHKYDEWSALLKSLR